MKIDVVMPKMGESVNEGTIIKWHKKKGEKVKKDEIIFEISTDKVDTEIPSPADGILADIKVFEQETVQVDTVVAVIETESSVEEPAPAAAAPPSKPSDTEQPSTTQVGGNIVDIPMPKMGESVMEGTIIKWHKKPGEQVKKDETLFEISTDKVDTEVPSPEQGVLTEILVGEQQTVTVGTIVARITTKSGVAKPQVKSGGPGEIVESPSPLIEESEKEIGTLVESYNEPVVSKSEGQESGRFYSPLVLNIARQENVSFNELDAIRGSGIEGRVTKKDILDYINNRKAAPASRREPVQAKKEPEIYSSPAAAPREMPAAKPAVSEYQGIPSESSSRGTGVEIIPMNNIRQKIMDHMVKSRDTSVHVSAIIEVDMTKIHNFIKNNKEDFLKRENVKLTYMPFIAYACIKAIKQYPYLNAAIDGTNIVLKKYINLGIAVAVEPNGLIVPNIKNADEKNITGLAKSIAELSNKSRTKKLIPEDISNGTFSITNYGVFGTLFGTPIINQPEVAILGVGTVTKKPVAIEVDGTDTISIRPMLYLSLSHDHRLVDGMLGGRFLKYMKDTLESFDTGEI